MSTVAELPAVMRADMRWRRWSRSEIIALAQLDAVENGYAPAQRDWRRRHDRPTVETVAHHCGSWHEMIEAAGLEVLGTRRRYTRERVLLLAQADVADLGRMPYQREWRENHERPSPDVVYYLFGSWAALALAAGVAPNANGGQMRWPRERVVALMQADARTTGRPPLADEWQRNPERPSGYTINRRFGSWSNLMRAAGFEPRAPGRHGAEGVETRVLRGAFLASGRTASDVARSIGWHRKHGGVPDESRLRVALGIKRPSGREYPPDYRRRWVQRETALTIIEALGLDPVDIGL